MTTAFRDIAAGEVERGTPIFQSESLKWPGFVEFDDVNSKVLTYSAQDRSVLTSQNRRLNISFSVFTRSGD